MKPAPRALQHLANALEGLEREGLLRRWSASLSPEAGVSFCSNDYLGLAERACSGMAGAGASRLVGGERPEHRELENAVAGWLGVPAALVFSSGYAANVGALSALAAENDLIVSDALNHASLIDGARLSRAKVVVVPHLDADAVATVLSGHPGRRAWVVTESYFSMDADTPDLAALRRACDAHGAALYVDEAHALGVLGPEGRGLCASTGVVPDVLVGTFGKAFGASGAFVAGCEDLVRWLWNRARPFIFSTAPSPVVARAALEGLRESIKRPELRTQVEAAARRLRAGMVERGLAPAGWGHIVPWIVGDAREAIRVSDRLRESGIHAFAIRPPSVPRGTARLRLTVTARRSPADIDRALEAIEVAGCLPR